MGQSAGKPKKSGRFFSILGAVILFLFKAGCVALAVATPVLGVWVSSSLAAYLNGPIWATILVGLLFFPLLPLAWEGFAAWRRSRKAKKRERILTFWDRLILRTLFLNLAFLVVLLAARPEAGFLALQARGDWMLDSVEAPWGQKVRPYIFGTANGLEWLYDTTNENPYADDNPDDDVIPDPPARRDDDGDGSSSGGAKVADAGPPTPRPTKDGADSGLGGRWGGVADAAVSDAGGATPDAGSMAADAGPRVDGRDNQNRTKPPRPPAPRPRVLWPTPAKLHPVVASMPRSAETSIKAVAHYIRDREPDELGRVRALHDWVADRVAYDFPALELPRLPPQDAQTIFRNRIGVCSGYSLLLRALGKAIDLNIVYVVGDSRSRDGGIAGGGHAWNAVKLYGEWHLIDSTWDAGGKNKGRFKKSYSTRYFLAPPEVFGMNHYPDRPQWQLRKQPISRGEFIRLPMLDPRFFINKMRLIEPTRSQITVDDEAVVRVGNPRGMFMLASFAGLNQNASKTRCQTEQGREVRIRCRFPRPGSWKVLLFLNRERYGDYAYGGQILINSI